MVDTGEGFRDAFEVLSLSEWENSTAIYMSIKWVFIAIVENARIFKNGRSVTKLIFLIFLS